MPMTAAQIVSTACAIAKCPGFTTQAGQLLNMILADLAETYDFEVAMTTTTVNLSSATGSGPYALPSDFLRIKRNDFFYTIDGVKYVMIWVSMPQYDALVQQAGFQNYPTYYTVDYENQDTLGHAEAYVWPPASGAYPATLRYYSQPADMATPETSSSIPWMPNQSYLVTRLAGELMRVTDDERTAQFLGEGPDGAQGILNRYLKSKENASAEVKNVQLDKRFFGPRFDTLRNTKTIGW